MDNTLWIILILLDRVCTSSEQGTIIKKNVTKRK